MRRVEKAAQLCARLSVLADDTFWKDDYRGARECRPTMSAGPTISSRKESYEMCHCPDLFLDRLSRLLKHASERSWGLAPLL